MVVKSPKSHDNCLLCGKNNRAGLNLEFSIRSELEVEAVVETCLLHQGYAGILHGGFITSLLDCAMCHAIFNIGIEGVTADMKVTFHKEVPCNAVLQVKAKVRSKRGPIYYTEAEVIVDGDSYASAAARFVRRKPVVMETDDALHAEGSRALL